MNYVFPSDQDRAENPQLNEACEYIEELLEQQDRQLKASATDGQRATQAAYVKGYTDAQGEPSSAGVSEAKEIINRVVAELESGFVACERCGDHEDTATLDCMGDLRRLQSLLIATPAPEAGQSGGVPESRREFWEKLTTYVDEFIKGYEFRGDDGDYVPNERERFLIEDCVAGLLHDMDEEGFLTAAPTAQAVQGAAAVAFGNGDKVVEVGTYGGKPAVFVAPAEPAGTPGELAPPTTGEDKHRLVPGEWVMTFPAEDQAHEVADALCGRPLKKLDAQTPTVSDHAKATAHQLREIANSLYRGYAIDPTDADAVQALDDAANMLTHSHTNQPDSGAGDARIDHQCELCGHKWSSNDLMDECAVCTKRSQPPQQGGAE